MTKENQLTSLLHLLVERLDGYSVDLVPMEDGARTGEPAKPGFSVGPGKSVRLEDIADIFTHDGGRQRRALEAIERIIGENIVQNDQPNRMLIDGKWHTGPIVDAALKILEGIKSVASASLYHLQDNTSPALTWSATVLGYNSGPYMLSEEAEEAKPWSLIIEGETTVRTYASAEEAKGAAQKHADRHSYPTLNSKAERLRDELFEEIQEAQADSQWGSAMYWKINALLSAALPSLRPRIKIRDVADSFYAQGYRDNRGEKWAAVFDTLRHFRLSNMADEDGGAYALVDLMSRDKASIADGEWEMVVLSDDILSALQSDAPNADEREDPHPDDLAVDRFALALKTKLAKKRDEGRGGWDRKDECTGQYLSHLLREHVEKGDPVDVGNFAMMLHQRDERIEREKAE